MKLCRLLKHDLTVASLPADNEPETELRSTYEKSDFDRS